jgi:hypothetical protein
MAQQTLFATFEDQLAALPAPRRWRLDAWDLAQTDDIDNVLPHVTATLPLPAHATLAVHLALAGATPSKYHVALVPLANSSSGRDRLDRLQAKGPVSAAVTVTEDDINAAAALRDKRAARGQFRPGSGTKAPAEDSPSLKIERENVELERIRCDRLELELRAKRLQAEFLKLDGGKPAASGSWLGALGQLAPIVVPLVTGWLDTQRRRADALEVLLTREPSPAVVQAPPAQGITLASLVELVPQVRELVKLVGGGLAAANDDEPASETVQLMQGVASLLAGIRGAPMTAPAAPAGDPLAHSPAVARANGHAPKPRLSALEKMNLRVTKFLFAVFEEQQVTADPAAAAGRLFPRIGELPEAFRQLLFSSDTVEALLSGLPRWLPVTHRTSVIAAIRNDTRRQQWLGQFLESVHGLADDDGADIGDDDAGELVGGDDGDQAAG